MKAFAEGSLDQCADVEKNLFGTGSNHANEIPVGITSPSSNLVEQETLVDIGNASKTEIDIPANFDYQNLFGAGSNHANEIPVGITSPSSNLVEQETLVDIGNAPKTEIDIPANFD
ncbi:hypothetical protein A4A49_60663 [Nicotiana attenuata]|uniref:Uncharacterized protein n=1 Tax=Nicotiana attenuata TaxID=49451 RepID=A0A1J6HWJ4_NICAT|nr:hypothetical protein A4A49_60663 [Nicotiana attenuata]